MDQKFYSKHSNAAYNDALKASLLICFSLLYNLLEKYGRYIYSVLIFIPSYITLGIAPFQTKFKCMKYLFIG